LTGITQKAGKVAINAEETGTGIAPVRRGLAGLLHPHVRLAPGRVPVERHALEGEFLRDAVRHDVAREVQVVGQVDPYLRVVVGEVLRDVEVAARVCLLRKAERSVEGFAQRDAALARMRSASSNPLLVAVIDQAEALQASLRGDRRVNRLASPSAQAGHHAAGHGGN
jgi:hypothetical protein